MTHRNFKTLGARVAPLALTGLALGVTQAGAQDTPPADFSRFEAIEKKGWFVRLGGRALFNVKASVSRSTPLPNQLGYFDNGFVLPDVGGTASGLTWNWGYEDYSQVSGNTLNYERYLGLPDAGSFNDESDIAPGGEMMFGVEFGQFAVGKKTWTWGAEMGGGYNLFEIGGTDTASGNTTYNTASYDTNGILLPVPPYRGTYDGPGPVIDLDPASTTSTSSAASSTVDGTLESSLYNLKLGVWFDMPLTEKLDLSWSAGFSSLYADTQYKFTEDIAFTDAGVPAIGRVDTTVGGRNWQQGGYLQARLEYNFANNWSAYVAGDYQYNGKLRFGGADRDVVMDFTALFGASLGISFNW